MTDLQITMASIAVALVLVGMAVFFRQARATSCPRHSRLAGRIAIVAGWASLIGGIGLFGYVILLLGTVR